MKQKKSFLLETPSFEKEYEVIMEKIDVLMKKGSGNLSKADAKELQALVNIAHNYEEKNYSLPMPKTLEGIIELKMFEMKLNQKEMAELLEVTASKLSQILNRKREPDLDFIRNMYKKLHIDPKFIMEHI
ncbi:HTH-type transcriptional regulator / antitoxin HigA [Chitinophaga sp. CF118]|uniref:helix-turn-helix domain-containing protein n=1 Tax=Chitinophaga sp. CF118 TaxID=1884367 RepID=UPI0008EBC1E4|nr:helix-turn-helix transcriptional regulator [Chitinophaga sp. CF118]SFD02316.1 HTH-type transcriptional regulator / antitoxin HigA [Chitinophaga sp. CF118]